MSQEIRESIELIQKLVNTEVCITMKNNDKVMYQNHITKIFPTFAEDYPLLFKKIIFHEDLSMLEPMLRSIDDIHAGKDHQQIRQKLGEQIAEKYLYPTMGKPVLPPEENFK
jgi:hypothetical protein